MAMLVSLCPRGGTKERSPGLEANQRAASCQWNEVAALSRALNAGPSVKFLSGFVELDPEFR